MNDRKQGVAHELTGRVLDGGWKVLEPVELSQTTGGYFSCGYVVESENGSRGFLKALDFAPALASPDPAREIEAMTTAFNFERDLLEKCKSHRLSRVVVALDSGKVIVDESRLGGVVQYLIFELADGDVRAFMDAEATLNTAWALRTLHHIAIGLFQLHRLDVFHRDLKPSNVLVFRDGDLSSRLGDSSKLADLGCAAHGRLESPYNGDVGYAPPEILYRYSDPNQDRRRVGWDIYLLGSMIVFFFTGVGMTSLWLEELAEGHRWQKWTGEFREVLPYIRDAFGLAVSKVENSFPEQFAPQLSVVVRQLCDPDPVLRGHPKVKAGNRLMLERYVSTFDRLARSAELELRKVVQ